MLRNPRLAFDWLSASFFAYWPIRMPGLLLYLHWINTLPHWITTIWVRATGNGRGILGLIFLSRFQQSPYLAKQPLSSRGAVRLRKHLFTDDQDVHMRQQTFKFCLKMLYVETDDREIIGGSFEFDVILLQLWNKIAISSRWPPSFKSLQITSSFLSLCSHIKHKALKNVPASGLSRSYCDLWRIRFWQVEMDFPSHGSQLSLAFLPSKSVVHGM